MKYAWNMKCELGNGDNVNHSRFDEKICKYISYIYAHCSKY